MRKPEVKTKRKAGKRYRVWAVDLAHAGSMSGYTWPKMYKTRLVAAATWGTANVHRATLIFDPPKPRRKK